MKKSILFILCCFYFTSLCKAQVFTIPYSDDFETGAPGWISSPITATSWELGTPTYGSINSSHSGINCWKTDLDSSYANSTGCFLMSPKLNFLNAAVIKISFWQNRNVEPGWDGFRLEYSTDTIQPWTIVGSMGVAGALNWYTDNSLNSSALPGWEGSSQGWIYSSIILPNFAGGNNVRFRFVFTSDASVTYDGVAIDDFNVISSTANFIRGTAYIDMNSDFIIDAGDVPAPNLIIACNFVSGYYYLNTNNSGYYEFPLDSGIAHTITPTTPLYSTIDPVNITLTPAGSGQVFSGNDFLVTFAPGVIDAQVNIISSPVRPGMNHNKYLYLTNPGTALVSGTVELTYDPNYTFISASAPSTVISPNELEFVYTALMPGESRVIDLLFYGDTTLQTGSLTSANAIIYPLAGDTNTVNNYDTVTITVVNSCDPNNKLSFPEGDFLLPFVNAGMDIDYTINFQNVGTAVAININIIDVLDEDLDISTFEITGSSHPITSWNINSNRQLQVIYSNINLADSISNEPESHGFLAYTIRPYTNLIAGTEISNTAAIFFDFNLPVITNTTSSIIVNPTGEPELPVSSQLLLLPNPNDGNFYLRADAGFTSFSIFNAIGQELVHEKISVPGVLQEVSHDLPSGLYLIVATGNNLSSTSTMIIE